MLITLRGPEVAGHRLVRYMIRSAWTMFLLVRLVAVLWLAILASAQSQKLPDFQQYRVSSVYSGPVKLPDFGEAAQYTGTDLRCFGDANQYANEHVNFAGHFVIVACTCGTGCHYLFVWDALNGRFYQRLPFGAINIGPFDAGPLVPPIEYGGEQYHADSTLLFVEGCFGENCDCGIRYYNWTGRRFRLISKRPTRKPPDCTK